MEYGTPCEQMFGEREGDWTESSLMTPHWRARAGSAEGLCRLQEEGSIVMKNRSSLTQSQGDFRYLYFLDF